MRKNKLKLHFLVAVSVAFGMLVTGTPSSGVNSAHAGKADKTFRGQIITSSKRLPTAAKSEAAYVAKIRKIRGTKRRVPVYDENKEKKAWKIYFVAFFKRPLNDLEITVKLYDVTDGRRQMVNSFEQYTDGRGQLSLTSYLKLERKFFGVNRKILIVMESRNVVLAQGTFFIRGEAKKFSGKADFSDDG